MTNDQIQFIFDALKDLSKDIKDLKKFKDNVQGGFLAISGISGILGLVYLVIRIMEVVKT